jgi:hypothetical protein
MLEINRKPQQETQIIKFIYEIPVSLELLDSKKDRQFLIDHIWKELLKKGVEDDLKSLESEPSNG